MPYNPTKQNLIDLISIYEDDLALNNLHWFICYKTQPKQIL